MDLALNNLRWLICHKSKPNIPNQLVNILLKLGSFEKKCKDMGSEIV